MAVRVTVYVERFGERFKVMRVKNSLTPRTGKKLSEKEVQEIIDGGAEVIIDVPKADKR